MCSFGASAATLLLSFGVHGALLAFIVVSLWKN